MKLRLGIFCVAAALLLTVRTVRGEIVLHAAPQSRGTASGQTSTDAARFSSPEFWNEVRRQLDRDHVTVVLQNGRYTDVVSLGQLGRPLRRLTIRAETPHRAIFAGPGRIRFGGAVNVTVRDLAFTDSDPDARIYKLSFSVDRETGRVSENILIEDCQFYDAPVYYGALGVSNGGHHVTIHRNTFRNIGSGTTAHMIYTAYDVHHIKVIGNSFVDCRGDYVRFRDNADHCEVRFNEFRSRAPLYNRPFVQMPVFNDVDPGDEFHASHYLFTDNTFTYDSTDGPPDHRDAMGYHTSGFDPPGFHLLPTADEAAILRGGSPEEKRRLCLDVFHIDLEQVRVYRNRLTNHNRLFRYSAKAAYGSKHRGWQGVEEIGDAIHSTPPIPGDVCVDGRIDERDALAFEHALAAEDERAFLLDPAVWFGDYRAADLNGDGQVDAADKPLFDELRAAALEN